LKVNLHKATFTDFPPWKSGDRELHRSILFIICYAQQQVERRLEEEEDEDRRVVSHQIGTCSENKYLSRLYEAGAIGKEVYDTALCKHQAAVDATKSQQRDEGEEYHKRIQH